MADQSSPSGSLLSRLRQGLAFHACLGLMFVNCVAGFAAEPIPVGEAEPAKTELESGMLLLRSGRVMKGKISHGGGEYRVVKSNGEMFVPEEMVHHTCRDLRDAYEKQLAEYRRPTATDHVTLARWCISYNLLEEARVELRAALALEPGRIQSRRMLNRLDEVFRDTPKTRSPRLGDASSPVHDVESLGGLSHEDAQRFTSHIQPILMNTCGNARCHGTAADNDFQLAHVKARTIASRHATQRNLAAVLGQIDVDKPLSSPLLVVPQGNHGGRQVVFGGRSGRLQMEELRDWVTAIANEKTKRSLTKLDAQDKLRKTLSGVSTKLKGINTLSEAPAERVPAVGQTLDFTDEFDPAKFNALNGK